MADEQEQGTTPKPLGPVGRSPGMSTPASAPAPPRVIGVSDLAVLHQGGFGIVYRGYQQQLDRWVAVKVIGDAEPERVRVRRFERECAIMGRLSGQRHVLRVHDSGYLHGGSPYLVTELCLRGSLADRLGREGRLPAAEVVTLARAIGGVLASMHTGGLLHRDVKPGNILFRDSGESVLADFGLAAPVAESDAEPPAASPTFTAPEARDVGTWTPAADVYALGATLRAALGGSSGTTQDAGALHALVNRMLAPDPSARPAAADAVAELAADPAPTTGTVDRSVAGAPFLAPGPPPAFGPLPAPGSTAVVDEPTQLKSAEQPDRPPWLRRARLVAGIPLAVLVTVVATSLLTGWPVRHAPRSAASVAVTTPAPAPSAAAPRGGTAGTPSAVPSPAGSPAAALPGKPGGGTAPAGSRWVAAAQGLRVAVPQGWPLRPVPGTAELRAVDPQRPARFVQVGGYRPGHASQLARVRGYASTESAGYRQIHLDRVDYGASPDAVDWEYTYLAGGTDQRAEGRYWRLGGAEYVVYASAPAADWSDVQPVFAVLVATARPH